MGKTDRASAIKKGNQMPKELKKELARAREGKGKDIDIEDEEPPKFNANGVKQDKKQSPDAKKAPRTPAPPKKMELTAGRSTFGAMANANMVVDSDSDRESEPEVRRPEPQSPDKVKKETEKSKRALEAEKARKKAKDHQAEMKLLQSEELSQRNKRMLRRVLRMLIVGVVLDYFDASGEESKKKKKAKPQKGNQSIFETYRRFLADLSGPLLMLAVTIGLIAIRAGEDPYGNYGGGEDVANFYEVLGVASDASMVDIKRSYKKLAMTWHPDKNKDCTTCEERFSEISKAYDTLSSPEKKKDYDAGRRSNKDGFKAASSVHLTADNFVPLVLRSSHVWNVQVFDSRDDQGHFFHPYWEEISSTERETARFGRIDISTDRGALDFLPMRPALFPTCFSFVPGEHVDIFQPHNYQSDDDINPALKRWATGRLPDIKSFSEATGKDALAAWWNDSGARPKVLIIHSSRQPKGGFSAPEWLNVRQRALFWNELVDIAAVPASLAKTLLGETIKGLKEPLEDLVKNSAGPQLVSRQNDKLRLGPRAKSLKEVVPEIDKEAQHVLSLTAPYITIRNHEQLCGERGGTHHFCLALVDMSDDEAAKALSELAQSRETYMSELADLRANSDSDAEAEDDTTVPEIQAVRLSTAGPRWPSDPAAADKAAFKAIHAELGLTSGPEAFLLEISMHRGVRTPKSLKEIYQGLAYEDLKLTDLAQALCNPLAWVPDPEEPLRAHVNRALSTWTGALFAFILLIAGTAVLPELPIQQSAAFVVGVGAVITASWPPAFRHAVGMLGL